jgi:hypothetical protein
VSKVRHFVNENQLANIVVSGSPGRDFNNGRFIPLTHGFSRPAYMQRFSYLSQPPFPTTSRMAGQARSTPGRWSVPTLVVETCERTTVGASRYVLVRLSAFG